MKACKKIKNDIVLMLIPFLGLFFCLNRIIPDLRQKPMYWQQEKGEKILAALFMYQVILLFTIKYLVK